MRHFCFFSYEIFPFTRGGAGTYITSVAVRLIDLGHRVTLVLDVDDETFQHCVSSVHNQSAESARLKLLQLSRIIPSDTAPRIRFPSDAHWKSFLFAQAVEMIHAKDPIDIVEFVDYCGPSYYTLLKRAAAPASIPRNIVVRMHNTIELIDKCASSNFLQSRVYDYWLERTAITLVDRILAPGSRYWNEVAARLYSIPPERITISPPCRLPLPRIADGINGRNIVFIGRISTIKGMDLFLQAMAIICADATLITYFDKICIIGPGETVSSQDEESILNYAREIPKDKIEFLGNLTENDLLDKLAHAQFAVFPNRCESFCYAAHEAHLVGVPLILSAIPAFLDHFVDRESALFFDGSVADLVGRIRELLVDSSLRARLSSSVLKHRERYNTVIYGPLLDDEAPTTQKVPNIGHVAGGHSKVSGNPPALTVVYFCKQRNRTTADAWINQLSSKVNVVDSIILVESASQGAVLAFGRRWDFGNATHNLSQPLNPGYLLLMSDEFILAPSFVERGIKMISMMPAVGAMLPVDMEGRWGSGEFGTAADLFSLRVGEPLPGFPLLMRLCNAAPIQQLLRDSSPYTALTLLLDIRATGLAIIDDVEPGLVRRDDKDLFTSPTRADAAAFVKRNLTRLRDFELATSLVDDMQSVQLRSDQSVSDRRTMRHILEDLYHGSRGCLYLHVIDGHTTIFSIVNPDVGEELGWQHVHLSGQYQISEIGDRPHGILDLWSGSCVRIEGGFNMVLNISLSPSGGKVALIADNYCSLFTTRHYSFSNRYVIPRVLQEFIAARRFEIPSREFHLSAYCQEPVIPRETKRHAVDAHLLDGCLFFENLQERHTAETFYEFRFVTQLHTQNKNQDSVVDEVAARTYHLGVGIACFFGLSWLDLVDRLLQSYKTLRVKFIVPPIAIWSPTIALQLLRLGTLLDRFEDRFQVDHPPALAAYFSKYKSTRAYRTLPLRSNNCAFSIEANTGIVVIIDRNLANEPYMGHMAAVVKILKSYSINIQEIAVPAGQESQVRIFEFFGLMHLVRQYQKFDDIITSSAKQIVYLNPFPFGENIRNVKRALQSGWHVVVTPYEKSLLSVPENSHIHVVHYWEDVDVIAQQLRRSLLGAISVNDK